MTSRTVKEICPCAAKVDNLWTPVPLWQRHASTPGGTQRKEGRRRGQERRTHDAIEPPPRPPIATTAAPNPRERTSFSCNVHSRQ
jgi:hypothetical protein